MPAILLHVLAASIYLALALMWRLRGTDAAWQRPVAQSGLALALLAHATTLFLDLDGSLGVPRFGFAPALSLTLWLAMGFYWLESFFTRLESLQVVAMPVAAVSVLLPLLFPGHRLLLNAAAPGFQIHFVVAMLAYSLLTLAALHALLMTAAEKQLHGARLSRLLAGLPPLLTLENLLFRLIWAGFILLTLTLGSGIFFSEALFGKALSFSHKIIFALAAWLVFGVLLAGRVAWGWRGRKALRLTLAGFTCLLLAYVGTRFVLEIVLGRSA